MEILFIIYLLLVLSFILYLVIFEYYNTDVRENLKNNINTKTSITIAKDELNRINCHEKKIYCTRNTDCLQICSNAIDDELQVEYKCNEINICAQSLLTTNNDNSTTPTVSCNRDFGFFPILTADEIFQPHWTCLNTRPYLFNDQQQYHDYICAGGDRKNLDPRYIFESCICPADRIKVRDEFRNNIPLCVEKHQLSLFPNFSK